MQLERMLCIVALAAAAGSAWAQDEDRRFRLIPPEEMTPAQQVSGATYKAALDRFGERGVTDLIAVSGY